MEYILQKDDFKVAPFFECLDDEDEIDINTFPFIDPVLETNREAIINIIKYLKTTDVEYLILNDVEINRDILQYL